MRQQVVSRRGRTTASAASGAAARPSDRRQLGLRASRRFPKEKRRPIVGAVGEQGGIAKLPARRNHNGWDRFLFPSWNRSRSLGVRGLYATCQHRGHERANKPPAGGGGGWRHLQVVVIAISNMRIIRLH
jgi:hypothetical protein